MSKDFYGFTFDGKHSSELGITRVSGGDRYKDNLSPDLEDKVVDIPGNDGQYYFGSYFNKREFSIEIAYDNITEKQLRELKQLFTTRELKPLIFDERPYITYFVKPASAPELNYICFDEEDLTKDEKTLIINKSEEYPVLYPKEVIEPTMDKEMNGKAIYDYPISKDKDFIDKKKYYRKIEDGYEEIEFREEDRDKSPWVNKKPSDFRDRVIKGYYKLDQKRDKIIKGKQRIYKGEGTITLVAYNPFGVCTKKLLTDYKKTGITGKEAITNIDEWAKSSRLLSSLDIVVPDPEDPDNPEKQTTYYIDKYIPETHIIDVYNPGDIATPPQIYISFGADGKINASGVGVAGAADTRRIKWGEITRKISNEEGIVINCQNHLIEGVADSMPGKGDGVVFDDTGRLVSYTTSGNIYNEFITSGDFFKIPVSLVDATKPLSLNFNGKPTSATKKAVGVSYDYYYI